MTVSAISNATGLCTSSYRGCPYTLGIMDGRFVMKISLVQNSHERASGLAAELARALRLLALSGAVSKPRPTQDISTTPPIIPRCTTTPFRHALS